MGIETLSVDKYYGECVAYLDNAATTKVTNKVMRDVMYGMQIYANPSALYPDGQNARGVIERARNYVREYIGADEDDKIIFTGSGSEANNLAIQGFCKANIDVTDLLIPPTEHPSVRGIADYYDDNNEFRVYWIRSLLGKGYVDPDNVDVLLDEIRSTWGANSGEALVSVMLANNETGVINPVEEITKICHDKCEVFVHSDATQAIGHIEVDVKDLGVDMLSFSGHKIGLPKGIGVLYVRKGIEIEPIIYGGKQESGLRAGTENLPYIYALGEKINRMIKIKDASAMKEEKLRDYFEERLLLNDDIKERCPKIRLNYKDSKRLPNISSVTFTGYDAKQIRAYLAGRGVYVSVGSACSSYEVVPSRTLLNLGFTADEAEATIRFSFSGVDEMMTMDRIDKVVEEIRCALILIDSK